jgi:hypothetical protein
VDATSYAVLIVGEAANSFPESIVRGAPEIPWADIRGMRNRIAHEYFGVSRPKPPQISIAMQLGCQRCLRISRRQRLLRRASFPMGSE